MRRGIAGQRVLVERPSVIGRDRLNAPIVEWWGEVVDGVLVDRPTTQDFGPERPEGERVAYTLHFPKGYGKSLDGCRVVVGGKTYRVVGDPRPYDEANVPGPWSMPVNVEALDG